MADGELLLQPRPWREVAEQLSREKDPARIMELSAELVRAIDAEKTPIPKLA